jgi:hypothetical protein
MFSDRLVKVDDEMDAPPAASAKYCSLPGMVDH